MHAFTTLQSTWYVRKLCFTRWFSLWNNNIHFIFNAVFNLCLQIHLLHFIVTPFARLQLPNHAHCLYYLCDLGSTYARLMTIRVNLYDMLGGTHSVCTDKSRPSMPQRVYHTNYMYICAWCGKKRAPKMHSESMCSWSADTGPSYHFASGKQQNWQSLLQRVTSAVKTLLKCTHFRHKSEVKVVMTFAEKDAF